MNLARNFTVTLLLNPYLLRENKRLEIGLKNVNDVYVRILFLLAEAMKFTFKISEGHSGGVILPNGTWTGMIGLLNRSEADIAVAPFFMSEHRSEAVSFSYPFMIDDITFVTKMPEYYPEMFGTFKTLSLTVWILLGIAIVTVTTVHRMLTNRKHRLEEILFNVLAIFLNQTNVFTPSTGGEQLLLNTWILSMALLTFCYKSVLLSFLSFPPLSGVRDVEELAAAIQAVDYKCMIVHGSSLPDLFLNSERDALKVIGDNIIKKSMYGTVENYLNQSHKSMAFIHSRESIQFAQRKHFVSEDHFVQTLHAMAVRRDFCCKRQLDMSIHRIVDSGLYRKFVLDYDFQMAHRYFSPVSDENKKQRKLSVMDISSAIAFLISGYYFSLVALLIEMMSRKKKKKKHQEIRNKF